MRLDQARSTRSVISRGPAPSASRCGTTTNSFPTLPRAIGLQWRRATCDQLSFVPEWSFGLSADYEWPVLGDSTAYVGGNIGYTGERPATFSNRDGDGNVREADSYITVDLRVRIDTGRWNVEIYGQNLTDEEGVNSIIAEGAYPNGAVALGVIRPRTFGLSLGFRY
jgi:hypothetical protein